MNGPTETSVWRTNYKAMSRAQLLDEQARVQASNFTDKAERLELIASELVVKS